MKFVCCLKCNGPQKSAGRASTRLTRFFDEIFQSRLAGYSAQKSRLLAGGSFRGLHRILLRGADLGDLAQGAGASISCGAYFMVACA
jgi:hypothetical protein